MIFKSSKTFFIFKQQKKPMSKGHGFFHTQCPSDMYQWSRPKEAICVACKCKQL